MTNKPEYQLSSKSSREEIVEVLKKLETDARSAAMECAYHYFTGGHTKEENMERQTATFEGKREMLHSLVWALGGTGEAEGVETPTVDIY